MYIYIYIYIYILISIKFYTTFFKKRSVSVRNSTHLLHDHVTKSYHGTIISISSY